MAPGGRGPQCAVDNAGRRSPPLRGLACQADSETVRAAQPTKLTTDPAGPAAGAPLAGLCALNEAELVVCCGPAAPARAGGTVTRAPPGGPEPALPRPPGGPAL
jgi:hypothetical protein